MKSPLRIGAALLVVAALVLSIAPLRQRLGLVPELPVLGRVPDFQLLSDSGAAFGAASLDGRPWLASFLYTSCPGPCPRLVERLKILRRAVDPAKLAFVSFSVDPQTDTAPVLARYKVAHGISESDSWTFVTGPPELVLPLVQKGFLTGVGDGGGSEGAVSHGTRVALVDGQRRIRGFYATDSDGELERLEDDAQRLQGAGN